MRPEPGLRATESRAWPWPSLGSCAGVGRAVGCWEGGEELCWGVRSGSLFLVLPPVQLRQEYRGQRDHQPPAAEEGVRGCGEIHQNSFLGQCGPRNQPQPWCGAAGGVAARHQPQHLCPLTSPSPPADGEIPRRFLAGGAAGLLAGRHHALAHLPRPVPLPDGGGHQPVLPHHHPAPGERRAGLCGVGTAPCPAPVSRGRS